MAKHNTYFNVLERYFESLPKDDYTKRLLEYLRETKKAYRDLKAELYRVEHKGE